MCGVAIGGFGGDGPGELGGGRWDGTGRGRGVGLGVGAHHGLEGGLAERGGGDGFAGGARRLGGGTGWERCG